MPSALSEEVVLFPESLLTAAAHPDPYPYYAALLAYRPIYREHRLGLWVALGAREVAEILSSQALRVRPLTLWRSFKCRTGSRRLEPARD